MATYNFQLYPETQETPHKGTYLPTYREMSKLADVRRESSSHLINFKTELSPNILGGGTGGGGERCDPIECEL